jgi:hypothetical protein
MCFFSDYEGEDVLAPDSQAGKTAAAPLSRKTAKGLAAIEAGVFVLFTYVFFLTIVLIQQRRPEPLRRRRAVMTTRTNKSALVCALFVNLNHDRFYHSSSNDIIFLE